LGGQFLVPQGGMTPLHPSKCVGNGNVSRKKKKKNFFLKTGKKMGGGGVSGNEKKHEVTLNRIQKVAKFRKNQWFLLKA